VRFGEPGLTGDPDKEVRDENRLHLAEGGERLLVYSHSVWQGGASLLTLPVVSVEIALPREID
jgi:hypothetical protein